MLTDLLHALKPALLALLLPPVPLLALVLLGAALLRRHARTGRALMGLGVLSLWLVCTEGLGQWLALDVIHTPPALSLAAIDSLRAEQAANGTVAVLVLGGGVRADVPEYHGPRLADITQERFRYGVWLARRLKAPLGFSGGIGWAARNRQVVEASVAAQTALDEYQQPLTWAEGRSRDTRENAQLSLALLKADGVKTVVLVTHDLHMPRAQQAFVEAAAGQMAIVVAPVGLYRDAMTTLLDWAPSGEGLTRVRYATYEWLALKLGH